MAEDADNVIIGQSGSLWRAPVGTTMPVNTTTAMGTVAAAWLNVGHLSSDGVSFAPSLSNYAVTAWKGNGRPVRRGISASDESFSFTMLEQTAVSLILAFGGGTMTEIGTTDVYQFDPGVRGLDEVEWAIVIEWTDRGVGFRMRVPRATVTELGEITLKPDEAASLSVTMGIVNEGTTSPFTIISPKTTWAPA